MDLLPEIKSFNKFIPSISKTMQYFLWLVFVQMNAKILEITHT